MRSLLAYSFLSLMLSCTPSTEVVQGSSSGKAINASAPYVWGNYSSQKVLRISNSFNPEEKTAIAQMGDAWKTSVANKKDFFDTDLSTDNIYDLDTPDSVMGVYKATVWPSDVSSGALAITQLFGRRYNVGEANEYVSIEHADILVNYSSDGFMPFDFYVTEAVDGSFDLKTVILHEMGHFLGLQHIPLSYDRTGSDLSLSSTAYKASSVMYPSIGTRDVKRIPQLRDINELINKYSLSASAGSAMVAANPYRPRANDYGKNVKVVIELMASGECIHKEDGAVIQRHHTKLK